MSLTSTKPAGRFVYRNPLDLPRISYADILANAAEGVHIEPPGGSRPFHRAPPEFHDDPDHAELFHSFEPGVADSPPVFTASLQHATLVGFRSVLSRDGFFINDLGHLRSEHARDFARGLSRSGEMYHLQPAQGEGVFDLACDGWPEAHLDGPVVLLTSAEAGNFASFLFRELPKLLNLPEVPASWRFLIHLSNNTFEQFLELAGLPMERVIRHDPGVVFRIEQAIVPGLRNPTALTDPHTQAFYAGLRAKCETGERGRRLYVSRHSIAAARPAGRVMLNEGELIARLSALGFTIVEPQNLTAAEQIAIFASAELVVGPSGSGLFNAAFCRPGTKLIDIESEPHWAYVHSCLFAAAGLRYGIFEGLAQDRDWSVHHKPWRVNIEALLERIEAFAPRCSRASPGARAPSAPAPSSGMADKPFWSVPDLTGEHYTTVLARLHTVLAPETYLEIGVSSGESLQLARCASIGIDPSFAIDRPVTAGKPSCCLYQMTSDRFFQRFSPSEILGRPIEMAYLDGMHQFEFLLRDFIHVERHCRPHSIILMHDCLPTDEHIGRRHVEDRRLAAKSPHPTWWAGDVWKALAILLESRPDLRVIVFNAVPTGLIAVTRLDPSSTVLQERYSSLLDTYSNQTLAEQGDSHHRGLNIVDTTRYKSFEDLSSLFWL